MPTTSRPTRARAGVLLATVAAVLALLSGCAGATPPPDPPTPQAAPAAPGDLTRTDADAWLDGLVPAALQRSGIAGATVSVVHDGRILTARGYGRADTGTGDQPARPVDADQTLFRVGSISKTFTATAVLQLVEQGRLDLDADVATHLDFPLATPRGPITLRHLLTHTAGFEERVRPLIEPPGTELSLRTFVAEEPPEQIYPPGTTPAYSNYGYSLAGYVVERVSGLPFDTYVQRHVLDRAGMTSSTFAQPLPDALAPRMAAGYRDDAQPATPFEVVTATPAGSLSSTATDMGRFMLGQLGALRGDRSLLRPDTLARMQRPGLEADALGPLAQGPRMTLGLFEDSRNGRVVLGHEGDTSVFHSAFEVYPDDGAGIFVSVNSTGRGATDAYDLRTLLLDGFGDRYFPAPGLAPAPETSPDAASGAAALAGTYESSRSLHSTFAALLRLNGQTRVAAQPDGTVLITPGPESFHPARYAQTGPSTWREVGGQRVISTRGPDGRVDAIGHSSAFTLLRTDATHRAAVAVPIGAGSLAVLLLSLLAWPATALLRRHYGATAADPAPRLVRGLRRAGVVAVVTATAGWALILSTLLGLGSVGDGPIRVVQVAQVLGLLAVAPAALHLAAVLRARARWTVVVGSAAVVLALVGMGWFALTFRLIAPSVSY